MNTVSKMIAASLSVGGTAAQLLIAASLTAVGTVPAHAQTVSVRVVQADLNLSSEAGQKTLVSRINAAAIRACGGTPEWTQREAFRACFKGAFENGISAMHTNKGQTFSSR